MAISSPSHLMAFLEEEGFAPKKSLSQNFLIDKNILHKIVKTAGVTCDDTVLEIGSGPGALTEVLLETKAKVIAVEKDEGFARKLSRFQDLKIFTGDIRDFPFETLAQGKVKVVANLPYHLTSCILSLLLPRQHLFSSLTLMVQDEVARRMTAQKGSKDYSSLSLFLNFYSRSTYAFRVSNRCFFPVPKVQSAVVHLEMGEKRDVEADTFFPLVRRAFQQRRKMLRVSLASLFKKEAIEMALEKMGCKKEERPENLSLDEWIALYRSLYNEKSLHV